MTNKYMKRGSTSFIIVNCKLKQQWDTTTHLLEWPKSKILTTPNSGKDVKQQELSFIAGENATWYNHLRRQLCVSYKTKHTFTIQSNNCAPWYLPKGVENLCP